MIYYSKTTLLSATVTLSIQQLMNYITSMRLSAMR